MWPDAPPSEDVAALRELVRAAREAVLVVEETLRTAWLVVYLLHRRNQIAL